MKSESLESKDRSKPAILIHTELASQDELAHDRNITRTPSPTASEFEVINSDNKLHLERFLKKSFWLKRDTISTHPALPYCASTTNRSTVATIVLAVIIVISVLFSVFDKQIALWLEPAARKVYASVLSRQCHLASSTN